VSLDSILCDNQVCRTWEDGQPLYEDATHLDLSGARVIGRALAEAASLQSLFVPRQTSTHASIHRWRH
jgi:hypothetical protein